MTTPDTETIRQTVREHYAALAEGSSSCCPTEASCCSSAPAQSQYAEAIGYSEEDFKDLPKGAYAIAGCGNPVALADLKLGQTVVDLGSGAGLDCFIAARNVGPAGRAIGVDMTPQMITKAREHAALGDIQNVEFRLGELENLPVADNTADVVVSNCVVNLVPDKRRVHAEAFRVLKPGGRIAISDIVANTPLPESVKEDLSQYAQCAAGAATVPELQRILADVGFEQIRITPKEESSELIAEYTPGTDIAEYLVSANIEAIKPVS